MAFAVARADRPLGELNTTPLIDVLLVLLVMFVITIPVASHSLTVDLPRACTDCPGIDDVKNKITIQQSGTIRWNGEAVSEGALRELLRQTQAMPVEPQLQYEPDGNASYAQSARVLNLIRQAGVKKLGFVGNERYRSFRAD
ncbi:MAG: biopolymer transporter ExbD [Sphingomonadales bacterium 32-64-17]|nr:MAG: biopolymer transporter ExbD [Sphingomonadales bacterium 32-64-17]